MNISPDDATFPLGSLVLVTGASGYIATHIVDQLLLAGYHVRGTVRTELQVAWTTELFTKRHGTGKFTAVIVPDMSISGAFDEAMKDVQGVVHTASTTSLSPDPNEVIPQVIAAVIGLLKSAANTPSIKSFVFTSSSMAADDGVPSQTVSFDSSSWNDAMITEAWKITSAPFPPTHGFVVYGASKAAAERALWKFVEEQKPSFKVNAILPDANFGSVLSEQGSKSTGAWMGMVLAEGVGFTKHLAKQWYVNVDDTARLHVAALVSGSVANERIFAYAAPFTWNEVLAALRNIFPDRKLDDDIEGAERSNLIVANERGEQLLRDVWGRSGWTSLEQTIRENVMLA